MKAKTYRITGWQLRAAGACSDQFARFRKAWPKGATLSLVNLRKAVELRLDLNWFAQHFLTPPARQAYEAARAPARQAYEAARATAWQAYEAATAPALQAYEAATAPALWDTIREHGLAGSTDDAAARAAGKVAT